MNIDYNELRQLDLNLLVALDVLIEEASVTKAAKRLNMSQSNMSYSLKKLRTILDDDILIRISRQMEVTPYAREISDRIRKILQEVQSTFLKKEEFNSAIADETFIIATSDFVEATIGIDLLEQLTSYAPNIKIRISNLGKEFVLNALDNNSIDLFIGAGLPLKNWHVRQELYQEKLVCVVKDDSLEELSIEDYIERTHILVSLRDDFISEYDRILEQQNLSRRIVWSTPHFMTVPFLLVNSNCMALLPNRMAQRCKRDMNLKLFLPPIAIEGFAISAIWHQRNNNSLRHQWLRSQIFSAVQDI